MTNNKDNKPLKGMAAFNVVRMLEGIPKDLRDMFVPDSEDGLVQLEMNIIKWLARARERENVVKLQKQFGLPLRPNQSLRDVSIRLKILELKKRQKFKDDVDNDLLSGTGN